MKRLFLTTALCALTPLAAQADDFLVRADIAEALVFGSGAEITRRGAVTLPAGRHRLIVAMPDLYDAQLPQVTGPEGMRLGVPQQLPNHPIEEGALDTPEQADARTAVEAAEDALLAAQDALTDADSALRSIETQQGYIAAILRGGESGVAMPDDPALVPQFLATLGAETERLSEERQAAVIARRDLADAVTEAQTDLNTATQALQELRPFGTQITAFAIDIEVADAGELEFDLDYLTGSAGWEPRYELALDSETGALEIERFVVLRTFGGTTWDDVAVTFSTAIPDRERRASELSPVPARISDPAEVFVSGEFGTMTMADTEARIGIAPQALIAGAPAPAMEPVVIVEETGSLGADFDGLSITYPYGEPVSVGPSGETILSFDTVGLETELENRAVPRYDETAFLVALVENTLGEPILPGAAVFFRDGALMGEGYLPLIANGADVEMGFGALDHLQLVWIDRSLAEGDRGLFTTSTTQSRELAFGVENTGPEAETVRILYATPFAEQEDLELDLTLSPRPTEEDVDDARGVHAWEIEVASGATELVEMGVDFEFPEGQVLNWQP